MLKTATILGAMALVFTASSVLADAAYKLDAKGACHDSKGKFAKADMCTSAHTYKLDAKGKCHDESGKFAKADLCKK